MVVEDWNHWTFGAFISDKWAPPVGGDDRIFRGNGSCFSLKVPLVWVVYLWDDSLQRLLGLHFQHTWT